MSNTLKMVAQKKLILIMGLYCDNPNLQTDFYLCTGCNLLISAKKLNKAFVVMFLGKE